MSEEQTQEAENLEVVADNNPSESPTEEPTTAPEPVEETGGDEASTSEPREESVEEGESVTSKSRSAQGRIKELVDERNNLRQQLDQYIDQSQFDLHAQGANSQLEDEFDIQPGQELTVEQMKEMLSKAEQRGESRAAGLVDMKFAQREALDKVRKGSRKALKEFPVLDPNNKEGFNKELSDAITGVISDKVRSNINTDVFTEVQKLMKPYEKAIQQASAREKETMAKQIAETASRPSSKDAPKQAQDRPKTWQDIENEVGVVRNY